MQTEVTAVPPQVFPTETSSVLPTVTPKVSATEFEGGIDLTEAALVLPLAPTGLEVEASNGEVTILWKGTGESLQYYLVFRKLVDGEEWEDLASVEAVGNNLGEYEYKDATVTAGSSYRYGVVAVNDMGVSSPISESEPITID